MTDHLYREIEELRSENERLTKVTQMCAGSDVLLMNENHRLVKALQDIKGELLYDISNGRVVLEIAMKALSGAKE